MMKLVLPALAVTLAATAAGCAGINRLRYLGDPTVSPETLAVQVCASCHSLDGNGTAPGFPRLAGQTRDYLCNQLTAFHDRARSDAGARRMWRIAGGLTTDQMKGLADYYSRQTPTANPIKAADAPRAELGRAIYTQGSAEQRLVACRICHGPEAHGNSVIPRLASQHGDYLVRQLLVFQDDPHGGRPGTPMAAVAPNLTREQMDAVALYLQALP